MHRARLPARGPQQARCPLSRLARRPVPHDKGKTGALWAPDADAFLCEEHALGGATMTLLYEPDDSKQTTVRVIG